MRMTIVAAMGMAIATLAACVPGQSEFSCQGYPDGVSCISARNVYELTNSRSRVTQEDIEGIEAAKGPAFGDVRQPLPGADPKLALAPPVGAGDQAAEPAEGVMRVWVGPHATSSGDVTAPNYVYSRVTSKPADPSNGITRRFEPLKGRAALTPGLDARPLEDGDVVVTAEPKTMAGDRREAQTLADTPGTVNPLTTRNVRVAEVYFDSGKASVSASGQNRLKTASTRIAELKPRSVLVAGFTDRVGSDEANQKLAQRRVDAVIEILKASGVTTEILDAAQGEPEELKPSPDGTADPNNRKVWVVALDVALKPASASARFGVTRTLTPETTDKAEAAANGDTQERTLAASYSEPSFWSRWFGGSSPASSDDARGCRLCRHPDDHGDNDDKSAKGHDPGMTH
ncbi:MAG: OmpA family protein [Alphaproteobacteria bacterium]